MIALWEKFKLWVIVASGLVAAGFAIWFRGRSQGKAAQKQVTAVQDAKAEVEAIKQVNHAHEVRADVEIKNSQLPEAPVQKVADADPSTAAGQLRDDGWVRPESDRKN